MVPPSRNPTRRRAGAQDLARAGERDARIQIAEYDASWPAKYDTEAARLRALVPSLEVHHIGSTAVPGLPAKPIIDLMAWTGDVDAAVVVLVAEGGYQCPEAYNATLHGRRWLCRPSAAHRTHHLHIVRDREVLERHLRFRDALRRDPSLAAEYADLKRELAQRFTDDREGYTAAKTAFVAMVEGDLTDASLRRSDRSEAASGGGQDPHQTHGRRRPGERRPRL